jgi:hypothetical protein
MKKASGKSNLSIVRDYLSGTRPFIQVGYDENVALQSRKEGEEWEDSNGVKWIKKNGYKHRLSKRAQYVFEQRCVVCNADMKWGNHLDQKIYPKTQRCYECNIEFESILRSRGIYNDYEKFKMINNELSMMKDFKSKVVDSISYLENYTPKTKDLQFFNEDGSNEIWVDDTDRREVVLKDLRADLEKVNDGITLAESELNKLNYNVALDPNINDLALKKVKEREEKLQNG